MEAGDRIMDANQLNGLALAYVGDAVYEVSVREHLIKAGMTKPNRLHKEATHYVSAKAQAALMQRLLDDDWVTEEEVAIYHRGRNAHSKTSAKNTDIKTYRQSTGFEALVGYLYLTEQLERLHELLRWCLDKGGSQHG